MPIALSHIRHELLPGLWGIYGSSQFVAKESYAFVPTEITAPVVSLPVAAAMGVAAAVVKNPTVTRRFLSWLSLPSN